MRKGIFSGETIYLTEKEWRELLKRFDLSKVIKIKNGEELYEIPSDGCYLCQKYRGAGSTACGDCPLNSEVNSCGDFMEEIVGDSFAFQAEVNSGVWWREVGWGVEARGHIRKIRKAIMNMERVRGKGR